MEDRQLVTFLSDFGTLDGYAGSVKGVIKSLAPAAEIIDITHEIGAFDINAAAFTLLNFYSYYPKDTIHLAVVDPGVGGNRRALIIRTAHHTFVGPDNGIFKYILSREAYTAYEIDTDKISGGSESSTFHARDIFAPVVAKLLKGVSMSKLGRKLDNRTEMPHSFFAKVGGEIAVEPIAIDRFGNIITGFSKTDLFRIKKEKITSIKTKNFKTSEINRYYTEKEPGEILALWNSQNYLEIAVCRGNAREKLEFDPLKDKIFIKFE
ncbi:MAG: S-adenosyl-l-methionine hydroxide adenosyltransferase family protein [Calditrichaceae bacterium]